MKVYIDGEARLGFAVDGPFLVFSFCAPGDKFTRKMTHKILEGRMSALQMLGRGGAVLGQNVDFKALMWYVQRNQQDFASEETRKAAIDRLRFFTEETDRFEVIPARA